MAFRSRKAIGYIVHDRELLVFTQPLSPEAGLQVPAGTIRDGETPADAVLREVSEETGLSAIELIRYIGVQEYDMTAYGREEVQERHVFELNVRGDVPREWVHYEEHDGMAPSEPFSFSWRPLNTLDPGSLEAGQGWFVDTLLEPNG